MPLNGGGTASRVPGTTAVPNTTIKSADYNAELDDVYNILNTARPIAYGGTGAANVADARTNLELDQKVVYAAKSGAYTALAADNNAVLRFTAAATLSLTAAATLAANWHITVVASGGAVTIDPNGSETINGLATMIVPDGTTAEIICDGSGFFTVMRPSGWQTIERRVFTGASNVDFVNLAGFKDLRIRGNVTLSTSADLYWRSSTDNGATFDAGASDYSNQLFSVVDAATGAARQAGATYAQIGGFATGRIALDIFDFGATGQAAVGNARVTAFSVAGSSIYIQNTGQLRNDAVARNAIRFGAPSATMTGEIVIEGSRA